MFKSTASIAVKDCNLPVKKDTVTFPGSRLKTAMEKALKTVGSAALHGIFEDLERRGIRLDSDSISSTEQIHFILQEVFGEDASKLMMSRIYDELNS